MLLERFWKPCASLHGNCPDKHARDIAINLWFCTVKRLWLHTSGRSISLLEYEICCKRKRVLFGKAFIVSFELRQFHCINQFKNQIFIQNWSGDSDECVCNYLQYRYTISKYVCVKFPWTSIIINTDSKDDHSFGGTSLLHLHSLNG